MCRVKFALSIFALVFFIPLHLHAEQMIKLGSILPKKIIENTIDAFVEVKQTYLLKRTGKEIKIEFVKPARELIIVKYESAMVPEEFKNEGKHPLFSEVVIYDIEKVVWKSYRIAVYSIHGSIYNLYSKLRKGIDVKTKIEVLKKDVEAAFKEWFCDIIPQPIPPCPEDCVTKTYRKTLIRFKTP